MSYQVLLRAPILISDLDYCTYLTYYPRGTTEGSQRARDVCYSIKRGHTRIIQAAVARINNLSPAGFHSFFGDDVVLVPAPRSSPVVSGGVWPSEMICRALVNEGLGRELVPCLKRISAVPKSAYARPGQRPSVTTHYDSMQVDAGLLNPDRILIVDDVITVGRTLLAAATRVREINPRSEVRVFALVRTQWDEITNLEEPHIGQIIYSRGDATRVT